MREKSAEVDGFVFGEALENRADSGSSVKVVHIAGKEHAGARTSEGDKRNGMMLKFDVRIDKELDRFRESGALRGGEGQSAERIRIENAGVSLRSNKDRVVIGKSKSLMQKARVFVERGDAEEFGYVLWNTVGPETVKIAIR